MSTPHESWLADNAGGCADVPQDRCGWCGSEDCKGCGLPCGHITADLVEVEIGRVTEYVSREMALDAGSPEMEGMETDGGPMMAEICAKCNGIEVPVSEKPMEVRDGR